MRLIDETPATLLAAFKDAYLNDTGKAMIVGSEEMTLSQIFTYALSTAVSYANTAYLNTRLSTAQGEALDAIAESYNLYRKSSSDVSYIDTLLLSDGGAPVLTGGTSVTIKGYRFYVPTSVVVRENEYAHVTWKCDDLISDVISLEDVQDALNEFKGAHPEFSAVYAQSPSYPTVHDFAYTEEGDDAFREYIQNNKYLYVAGLGRSFEQFAMAAHPAIQDAYVLRQTDEGFREGYIQLYVKFDMEGAQPMYDYKTQVLSYLADAIKSSQIYCVGQNLLPVVEAQPSSIPLVVFGSYSDQYTNTQAVDFVDAVTYFYNKTRRLGDYHSDSIFLSMLLKRLPELSSNPKDFGLTDDKFTELSSLKLIVAGIDEEETLVRPQKKFYPQVRISAVRLQAVSIPTGV